MGSRTCVQLGLLLALVSSGRSEAQRADSTVRDTARFAELTAGEADGVPKRRNFLRRTDYDLGVTTFNFGAGFLWDLATYSQDAASREQVDVVTRGMVRDGRFLIRGKFKTQRQFTWQAGIMYDVPSKTWRFRQSGLMVGLPELWGSVFVGRAKEGISLNKVMVGYDGWTNERTMINDAIPILADGIKWLGYSPERH